MALYPGGGGDHQINIKQWNNLPVNRLCGQLAGKARYWKVEECLKTCFSVAWGGGGIWNFWQSGGGEFVVPQKKSLGSAQGGMVTAEIDRCLSLQLAS